MHHFTRFVIVTFGLLAAMHIGGGLSASVAVAQGGACSVSWNTDSDGFWDVAANWSTGTVPGSSDDVCLGRAGANPTITIRSGTQSVRSLLNNEALVLSAGSLSLSTSSESNGVFTWTGGFLRPTGGLTNTGRMVWSGGHMHLGGGTLSNAGTVAWRSGQMHAFSSVLFDNLAGATFDIQVNESFWYDSYYGSGMPTFRNAGIVRKSAGTGTSYLQLAFSGGNVEVLTGTLTLNGDGTTTTGGSFTVATGAVLDLTGGTNRTYIGSYSGSGAGAVRLSNGTLTIGDAGATFDFSGDLFQWTGGFLRPTGGLTNIGRMVWSGGHMHLGGGTLSNAGTVAWRSGQMHAFSSVLFDNLAGATFDIQANEYFWYDSYYGSGMPTLRNAGIVRKSAGTGTSYLQLAFSGGNVEVLTGTLTLNGEGTTTTGGSFTVATGAVLDLTGGTNRTYTGSYSGSGAGAVRLSNGTLTIGDAGATFDFDGDLFQWTGGTLKPSGGLANAGRMVWSGGHLYLDGGTLSNAGTVTWASGQVHAFSSALFDNLAGATFDIQANEHFWYDAYYGSGMPTLRNAGIVRKSAGSGTSFLQLAFSGGAVEVITGTLTLNGDGTTTTGGSFTVATGAVLDLTGGTNRTYIGSYSGSGAGAVRLSNGTLTIGDAGATFDFSGDLFQWTGGFLRPTGGLTNIGRMVWSGGHMHLGGGTLSNAGTVTWASGQVHAFSSALFTNQASGIFDIQANESFWYDAYYGAGPPVLNNTGLLRRSVSSGIAFIGINTNQTGSVEVRSGTLNFNGGVVQVTGNTLNGGIWNVFAGATLAMNDIITTNNATIALSGVDSAFPAINNLAANGGSFSLRGGRDFATAGAFNNTANLTVGAGSTFAANGNYTQGVDASLTLEIAGAPASNQFGRLTASGVATLDGALDIRLVDNFSPGTGQRYQVMSFASRVGEFAFLRGAVSGRAPVMEVFAGETEVVLNSLREAIDLAVEPVEAPASATPGQNVTISYTVHNKTGQASSGSWIDAVYVSTDSIFDPSDRLLGRVRHNGGVAGNGSYNETLTAPMPGAREKFYIIVIADSRGLIADLDRANNRRVSANTGSITIPVLALGEPVSGMIANGQEHYFRVDGLLGRDLRLTADFAVPFEAEFYVRFGDVPDPANYDFVATSLFGLSQEILLTGSQGGPYYIMLRGREPAGSGQSFSLTAAEMAFELRSHTPNRGSNAGQTTLTLVGSGFSIDTEVRLAASSGSERPATKVVFKDSNTLFVTFDLGRLMPGAYDIRLVDGSRTTTREDVFSVTTGAAGDVVTRVSAPFFTRPWWRPTVTVEYQNVGDADVAAPWLVVRITNGLFVNADGSTSPTVQFLGINSSGPAGVLPPGARNRRDFTFQPNPITSGTERIDFELVEITDAGRFFDVAQMKADLKPDYVPAAAWDVVFANFTARAGSNLEQLHTVLAEDATYFSTLDDYESNITPLLFFELGEAGLAEITPRHLLGAFGRGRFASWEISATSDATGKVRVRQGQGMRSFQRQANGTYRGAPGDWSTLKSADGAFTLREKDGSLMVFRPDGKLAYIEDSNGDRLTLQYTGDLVTSRTYPNGDVEQIEYNAQGRVARLIDPVGRATTFTYDASGEHLLSTTTPQGTTRFSYMSTPGAADEHALQSITFPDGVTRTYSYDARGLLNGGEVSEGVDRFSMTRTPGCQTVTNAIGSRTQVCRDGAGLVRRSIDPFGRTTRVFYDANRNLTRLSLPGGSAYNYGYDERGNLISQIDPLGRQERMVYDPELNRLRMLTDARGNTTTYGYDAKGNLTSTAFADGSKETWTYGSHGLVTSWTNRRGQTVMFGYNAADDLVRKDLPAAPPSTFSYDAQRNVTMVANGDRQTTYTYDAKGRLARVTDPDGRFLQFSYDEAGRRTRMEDQSGVAVIYRYDGAGRLAELADGSNKRIAAYTYDAVSQLVAVDRGNGTRATYAYDAAGKLLTLRHLAPDGAVQSYFEYAYDPLGRPASATTTEGTATFSYDAAGQLIATSQPGGRTITYRYDAAGNRLRETDDGVVTEYRVNALNQYTTVGAARYSYDADGNLIAKILGGQTTTFSYDAENRLSAIVAPGSSRTFEYDAHEMLGASVVDGVRTEYMRDPMGMTDVVAEYSGTGDLRARYVYGMGLVSRVDAAGAAYYGFDAPGNTALLTGAAGEILNSYSYLPFGEQRLATGSAPNGLTYSGQWGVLRGPDELYYMRARWYDAETGRFITRDPVGVDGGDPNFYRYVHNSPVALIDPSGLQGYWGAPGGTYYPGSSVPMQETWLESGAARPAQNMPNTYQGYGSRASHYNAGQYTRPGLDNQVTRGQVPPRTPPSAPPSAPASQAGLRGGTRATARNFLRGAARRIGPVGTLVTVGTTAYGGTRLILENTEFGRTSDEFWTDTFRDWWFDDIPTDPVLEQRLRERLEFCRNPANAGHPWCRGRRPRPGTGTTNRVSGDPNDIVGPAGFGEQQWISGEAPLPYTIRFENRPDAAAPATFITIVQQLDADLDPRTFELGDFGWAGVHVSVPAGRSSYSTRVDQRDTIGLFVDVTGSLDATTGRVTWSLTAIDPATGDLPGPNSPADGFLFPNDATHRGEGFVSYRVRSKPALATGMRLDAQARIVFDTNEPIDTPAIFNTLDLGAPTSSVSPLPATSPISFTVSWAGSDDPSGSGIAAYDVYVSVDNGSFEPFLLGTSQTSATFSGAVGHSYAFYSVAIDNVGHRQSTPVQPQASTTTVDAPSGNRRIYLPQILR